MKKLVSLLCTLSALAQAEGGWSGGGGDVLRLRFVDAKKRATSMVQSIQVTDIPANANQLALSILKENQIKLAEDIQNTPLKFETHSGSGCAFTAFEPKAPVYLDHERFWRFGSDENLAWLLIHESVHHLGIKDEDTADAVATLVRDSWNNGLLNRVPMCPNDQNIVAERIIGSWILDVKLAAIMTGQAQGAKVSKVTFVNDERAAALFPSIGSCATTAGFVTFKVMGTDQSFESPFIITTRNGNPTYFFDKEIMDRKDHWQKVHYSHPGNLMLAKAFDSKNDMLFVGGDNNNQPLYPFKRIR